MADELKRAIAPQSSLGLASSEFSIFAFAEFRDILDAITKTRLVLPQLNEKSLSLFGGEADRAFRNRLHSRTIARQCKRWLEDKAEIRSAQAHLPQSAIIIDHSEPANRCAITGNCPFTMDGLGFTPGNRFSLIQSSETAEEWTQLNSWFSSIWDNLPATPEAKNAVLAQLQGIIDHKAPSLVYHAMLYHLFKDRGDELDEERIIKSATGIRNTLVWKKLYRFQRDGVFGAIDKLERIGGCIIADSVGLGKTFEALAIVKYYELRNDRVLVLCPKRLRDNWTLYKANDKRNSLAADRFNYDVLNHTDLSRDNGLSGDIDLSFINWGNYDLVVIDESHNFRNNPAHRDHETRYERMMQQVIKSGVKTKVLMLSATPVNNRLADLKNQIGFITEGEDEALAAHNIPSIESTIRQAQLQFKRWLDLDEGERKPAKLIDMLGFDYFKLLDLLTIARSRKHIVKYYGIAETGKFPDRLKPVNIRIGVDLAREFLPVREINNEIRRLNLSAYAPLRYVLPEKKTAYDEKYSTKLRDGKSIFRQADREESLVHLLRVNILKRMESSVNSFALTLGRQLADVNALIARIDAHEQQLEELDIADIEIDDPAFEPMLVGRKVKVLLQDVDRIKWRQDLVEDRNRIASLLASAEQVGPDRDAKLAKLRELIKAKLQNPVNSGNRKIIVFTAFADTANYLYAQLSGWAKQELGVNAAILTGTGTNKTTLPGMKTDLATILTAFSPRSKERADEFSGEGEIDLLIATDCISEGQNLQDCDYLVNYDIHWNPIRIIQRFGRIDRLGSPNTRIQLVNFWPDMDLEEYINLEQRVSGRMVLLDVSATGEENIIEYQSGNQMNDLEYRRKQLEKLQDTVIDIEDLSGGISITDLTLNDFRADLAGFLKNAPANVEALPLGMFAVVRQLEAGDEAIEPGIIFCLRGASHAALKGFEPDYPLAPHYLVHVGENASVVVPFSQPKQVLDRLKKLASGRDIPDTAACAAFDKSTRDGQDMSSAQKLLSAAISSIIGKKEERSVASLFKPGGTHSAQGEFCGINDFEVTAFLVVLPSEAAK